MKGYASRRAMRYIHRVRWGFIVVFRALGAGRSGSASAYKSFPTKAHGGKVRALKAARRWRDKMARHLRRLSYLNEQYRARTFELSTGRVSCVRLDAARVRHHGQVVAVWRVGVGRKRVPPHPVSGGRRRFSYRSRHISCRQHGYVGGFKVAVLLRFKALGLAPPKRIAVPMPTRKQRRALSWAGVSVPMRPVVVSLRRGKR